MYTIHTGLSHGLKVGKSTDQLDGPYPGQMEGFSIFSRAKHDHHGGEAYQRSSKELLGLSPG